MNLTLLILFLWSVIFCKCTQFCWDRRALSWYLLLAVFVFLNAKTNSFNILITITEIMPPKKLPFFRTNLTAKFKINCENENNNKDIKTLSRPASNEYRKFQQHKVAHVWKPCHVLQDLPQTWPKNTMTFGCKTLKTSSIAKTYQLQSYSKLDWSHLLSLV